MYLQLIINIEVPKNSLLDPEKVTLQKIENYMKYVTNDIDNLLTVKEYNFIKE